MMKSLIIASLALCAIAQAGNVQARDLNEYDKATRLQYMRDKSTGICFVMDLNGGQIIGIVDCGKIKPELLPGEQNNDD